MTPYSRHWYKSTPTAFCKTLRHTKRKSSASVIKTSKKYILYLIHLKLTLHSVCKHKKC